MPHILHVRPIIFQINKIKCGWCHEKVIDLENIPWPGASIANGS
jgi:hypothetical protein